MKTPTINRQRKFEGLMKKQKYEIGEKVLARDNDREYFVFDNNLWHPVLVNYESNDRGKVRIEQMVYRSSRQNGRWHLIRSFSTSHRPASPDFLTFQKFIRRHTY